MRILGGSVLALVLVVTAASGALAAGSKSPPPPELPKDFTWTGTYKVPDLDVEVPFTWHGRDGNMQMEAGSDDDPIHFTNLIYDGTLYTLTYEWPGIPRMPCSNVGPFTREQLNEGLAKARFVGPETLERKKPRKVNHFRAGVVVDVPPGLLPEIPGVPLRLPLMSGDIYTDRQDPEQWWEVLQFGLQNLYDAEQDEWIHIDRASTKPGKVELPDECATAPAPSTTPST